MGLKRVKSRKISSILPVFLNAYFKEDGLIDISSYLSPGEGRRMTFAFSCQIANSFKAHIFSCEKHFPWGFHGFLCTYLLSDSSLCFSSQQITCLLHVGILHGAQRAQQCRLTLISFLKLLSSLEYFLFLRAASSQWSCGSHMEVLRRQDIFYPVFVCILYHDAWFIVRTHAS